MCFYQLTGSTLIHLTAQDHQTTEAWEAQGSSGHHEFDYMALKRAICTRRLSLHENQHLPAACRVYVLVCVCEHAVKNKLWKLTVILSKCLCTLCSQSRLEYYYLHFVCKETGSALLSGGVRIQPQDCLTSKPLPFSCASYCTLIV